MDTSEITTKEAGSPERTLETLYAERGLKFTMPLFTGREVKSFGEIDGVRFSALANAKRASLRVGRLDDKLAQQEYTTKIFVWNKKMKAVEEKYATRKINGEIYMNQYDHLMLTRPKILIANGITDTPNIVTHSALIKLPLKDIQGMPLAEDDKVKLFSRLVDDLKPKRA